MEIYSTYQEKTLVLKLSEGSEDAFRDLFNAYRKKLYTYIFRMTKSREMAEDTVHDVFLKIWENRRRLIEVDNFNGYLFRMAHNHAFTCFRRIAKETLILAELQNEQSGLFTSSEGEELIVQREVRDFIRKALNKLTEQQKTVFVLSRQEGLRNEDIAQKLNISVFTVKNHLASALRFLRQQVAENYSSKAVALYVIYGLTTQ